MPLNFLQMRPSKTLRIFRVLPVGVCKHHRSRFRLRQAFLDHFAKIGHLGAANANTGHAGIFRSTCIGIKAFLIDKRKADPMKSIC